MSVPVVVISRAAASRRRLAAALGAFGVLLSVAAPGATGTRLPGIQSPSGNISCLYIPSAPQASGSGRAPSLLLCELAHATYAATLQSRCLGPSGGGVDWHGFTLTATGRGAVNCSGGILYRPELQRPAYVTLGYGKSWRQGVFTCWSRVTGVTCRNRKGHGLFVSRQAWRVW